MIDIDSYEDNLIRLRALMFTYKNRGKMNIVYNWNGYNLKIKANRLGVLEVIMIKGLDVSKVMMRDIKQIIDELWKKD